MYAEGLKADGGCILKYNTPRSGSYDGKSVTATMPYQILEYAEAG